MKIIKANKTTKWLMFSKILCCLFVLVNLLLITIPVFAADHSVRTEINTYVKDIVKDFAPIFNVLCVTGMGFAILQLVIASNDKVVSNAFGFIKTIVLVFLIFNTFGVLVNFIDDSSISHNTDVYSNSHQKSSISDIIQYEDQPEQKGDSTT